MLRRLSLCCLLVAALVTGGFAQQQNDGAPVSGEDQIKRWLRMDSSGDGKLSKNEATGLAKRFFDRVDSNKDGFLDQKELESLQRRVSGNRGRQLQSANSNRQQGNRQQGQRPQPRHAKGRPVPMPWLGFGHDDHASIASATYLKSADAIRTMALNKGRAGKLSYPKSTGLRIVGTGHSWMRPAYRTLPLIANAAGIEQQLRTSTRGGEAGGARMMWEYENGILSSKGKANPICMSAITTGKWDVMLWGGYTDDRSNYYRGWIEFCLKHNPEMHFYRFNGWPQWAHGFGEDDREPKIENYRQRAAKTHERSVEFFAELNKHYPGKVHVLPTNEAMLGALELYFQGKLPGIKGLNRRTDGVSPSIWSDGGHLGAGMDLLEGYVFYATLYKRSPELIESSVEHKSVSSALDKVFRKIAWQAVVNNPLTGVVDKNGDGVGESSASDE